METSSWPTPTSRVAVYYQGLAGENCQATYLASRSRPASSPACMRQLPKPSSRPRSMPSGGVTALTGYPMPITLADEQVMFNGAAAPLYFAGPGQINFLVPMSAPVTGTADVEVVQASTGQVLGASNLPMATCVARHLLRRFGRLSC
jgi:hypothetical protein